MRALLRPLAALLAAAAAVLSTTAARAGLPFGQDAGAVARVVTFNIQTCKLYDAQGTLLEADCTGVVDVIAALQPDFVALQEVRDEAQAAEIATALGMNHFFGYALEPGSPATLGNAILTPHPILAAERHLLPRLEWEQRVLVEVLSQVDGVPVRVYSTHLTFSARPDKDDQVMAIMDIMARRDEPRILMGDFNDADARPTEAFGQGYVNLITGAGHGTLLPSVPKMHDLHRKVAVAGEVRNDPPFFSPLADIEPPHQQANTITAWNPRARIDHIYVSPDFALGAPHNKAWVVDTSAIIAPLHPGKPWVHVSDHKPVAADVLLPKPPVQLFLNPQQGPTIFMVGESRVIQVGGIDADGNTVSLLRTDTTSPLGDPAATARIVQAVDWTYTGSGGHIDGVDPTQGYDAFIRSHRPATGKVRFTATAPGEGTLRATVGGVQATLSIKVLAEGTEYNYGM